MFNVDTYVTGDDLECPLHPHEILKHNNYYVSLKDSGWAQYKCPQTNRTINMTPHRDSSSSKTSHPRRAGLYIEIQTTNWGLTTTSDVQLAYYVQIVWDGTQWVARNRNEETGRFEPEVFWQTPVVYPEIEALHELQEVLNVS